MPQNFISFFLVKLGWGAEMVIVMTFTEIKDYRNKMADVFGDLMWLPL